MPFHLIILVFAFVLGVVAAFWNPPGWTLGWLHLKPASTKRS